MTFSVFFAIVFHQLLRWSLGDYWGIMNGRAGNVTIFVDHGFDFDGMAMAILQDGSLLQGPVHQGRLS